MDILKIKLEVWKKVVDVQMHFNDLCLKIRSFAISILGVLLGAAAIAYKYAGFIEIGCFKFHASSVFIVISIIVWFSFYFMDRFWYHELLKASVCHGEEVERELKEHIPEIGLATSIHKGSHRSLGMKAATKLNIFYCSIGAVQITGLLFVLFCTVEISS